MLQLVAGLLDQSRVKYKGMKYARGSMDEIGSVKVNEIKQPRS
jgi:hypothetical protein